LVLATWVVKYLILPLVVINRSLRVRVDSMKVRMVFSGVVLILFSLISGCATNFAGKTPSVSNIKFISGNELMDSDEYEIKGVIVVERSKTFFDIFGLVKPRNIALEEAFTENIANELTKKAVELDANAITDMEIVAFHYTPISCLSCLIGIPLPIGNATVIMQATAIKLRDR
jgi:hypothetical protein